MYYRRDSPVYPQATNLRSGSPVNVYHQHDNVAYHRQDLSIPCSRSASPIIDVGQESPDVRLLSPGSCTRCSSPPHDESNNNDDKKQSPPIIAAKLSFGIHRILGGALEPSRPRSVDSDSPPPPRARSPSPEDLSPGGGPSTAYHSPRAFLHPHAIFQSPAFGPPGFAAFPRAIDPVDLAGVIKVPAHRPLGFPSNHSPFSSLMFPWMQERKDRLTGEHGELLET